MDDYKSRDMATPLACGQCLHCRINQSREWTHRLLLENATSTESAFITLTYEDEKMPHVIVNYKTGETKPTLCLAEYQSFIKKVRKHHEPTKIRYYGVGEYGRESLRPHYHLALFCDGFIDRESMQDKWKNGFASTGELNAHSARYITGYLTDKVRKYTQNIDLIGRAKEFQTSSKKGGIGLNAIKKIAKTINAHPKFRHKYINQLRHGGKLMPLGRYLTAKLFDELGFTKKEKAELLQEYQNQIFNTHLDHPDNYLRNVLSEKEQKRLSQKSKFKIFNQRITI